MSPLDLPLRPATVLTVRLVDQGADGLLLTQEGPSEARVWTLPGGPLPHGVSPAEALPLIMRERFGIVASDLSLLGVEDTVLERVGRREHHVALMYAAGSLARTGALAPQLSLRWSLGQLSLITWDWVVKRALMRALAR